ncbi:hypothetical protein JNUCC64_18985 [Streptomyces sp. JNUCC 64]
MKPLKAAAVVAGSFALVGAAAPAFAASDMTPTSLNGALETFTSQSTFDARALQTNAIDTEREGTLMNNVKTTTERLNAGGSQTGSLLGGLPVGK